MNALTAAEIRERYLSFFEERGHQRMASDSLVPANDPTLLFTGAGMNQFKDMFMGKGSLPHKRVTTAQKCLRVPDLENVGVTPRHHTFFEMLGNFSFGDYFKNECIPWEWEFFTKALGIPAEQLVVTIYHEDDDAAAIWMERVGLAEERIFRFGEKENFWPAEAPSKGPNGPCGPCSEIYFDDRPGEPFPDKEGLRELPEGRFTEIGNCVFTQFERRDGGELVPLPQKNIDVGLGLERIAAVLQGAPNNFETDLFRPYLEFLGERTGRPYGEDPGRDQRMRRIADHARAVTFCIADGAVPSNEGRGYVVRKILRRAARDGFELGLEEPFLHEMVDVVGRIMGAAYPEIVDGAAQCRALIRSEEEGFAGVYRRGMVRLSQWLEGPGAGATAEQAGAFAFELHDTFGFPADITRQALLERSVPFSQQEFDRCMAGQRDRARAHASTSDAVFAENAAMVLRTLDVPATEFDGYDHLSLETEIAALLGAGDVVVDRLASGETGVLVVPRTPFYAQGGGQVGDQGDVVAPTGRARIADTTRLGAYQLHRLEVVEGHLERGSPCTLAVDGDRRRATERNHTATHLLHAALKEVLGTHVSQAGSEVSPERLRFDYTHPEKPSDEQLQQIEVLVQREIIKAVPVQARVQPMAEARKGGFVALFGEKYGDEVRTLAVGEFSRELCGGTHVANSGNIGAFRITTETAVSAGTRRIEALTGMAAFELGWQERAQLSTLARTLKVQGAEVVARVDELVADNKRLRKALVQATAADLDGVLRDLTAAARSVGDIRVVIHRTKGLTMKEVQEVMARARKTLAPLAGVLLVESDEGVLVGAAVDDSLVDRIKAGDLVRELTAVMGGGGGGRPQMAQGKGKNRGALGDAMARAEQMLAELGT